MPDELFDFQWYVEKEGHKWLTAPWQEDWLGERREPDLFLSSGVPEGVARSVIKYYPLRQHTGLFRHFAAIKINHESIQEFADTYGLLGDNLSKAILLPGAGPIQITFESKDAQPKETFALGIGETILSWAE